MNILTFDIEEWYLESRKSARNEKYEEYDRYLNAILDKLDARGIKATFFCVGEMGRLFPEVIRRIDARGHEVGCHSNVHTWLNKMTEAECREDTRKAVDSLEQCLGKKILSYRAPAFSIGEKNTWAFDILVENGIERDASVFPAARDFGGFPNFGIQKPVIVKTPNGNSIKEFPIPMVSMAGKQIAYSGGGYFRFFPLWLVKQQMAKTDYAMTYFHISDLLPESNGIISESAYEAYFKEPGTIVNRYKRYLKSNLGKKSAFSKMMNLMDSTDFINLEMAEKCIEWK